jgi:threonine dehydratase
MSNDLEAARARRAAAEAPRKRIQRRSLFVEPGGGVTIAVLDQVMVEQLAYRDGSTGVAVVVSGFDADKVESLRAALADAAVEWAAGVNSKG